MVDAKPIEGEPAPVTMEELKNTPWYDEFRLKSSRARGSFVPGRYKVFLPTVFKVVVARREKDPIVMLENVIDELRRLWDLSPEMPANGPWHHTIVPGVLIAALRNNGYPFTDRHVEEALKRGAMTAAAACGFMGNCGAAVGLGIAVSVITKATPYHDGERSLALRYTAEALNEVAKRGGPHCCRLASYVVILHAVRVFEKEFGYKLLIPEPKELIGRCTISDINPTCHKERCMFNPIFREKAKARTR